MERESPPARPLPTRSQRGRRRRTWRRVLALVAVLVVTIVAVFAVSVLAYLRVQFDRVANVSEPVQHATHLLAPQTPGKPVTALIIGTDRRPSEEGYGRSDTLILVRVFPADKLITVMSIPRSTPVELPGVGSDLINAAYSYGGPELSLQMVKEVTGLDVNYLVVVGFDGFKDVINAMGGLYIDVDHRYLYDGPTGGSGFEPIDLEPGYQRLTGAQALDFARDRHADSDYYRIARQQLVVHELRRLAGQLGGSPYQLFLHFSKVLSTVHAVAGSTDVGAAGGKLKFSTAVNWARTIQGIPESRTVTIPVSSSSSDSLAASVQQFLHPAKATPAVPKVHIPRPSPSGAPSAGTSPTPLANASVTADPTYAKDAFAQAGESVPFRVMYPTVRELESALEDPVRAYSIETGGGATPALRATFDTGNGLEFWGIEETTWTNPPLLREPSRTEKVGERTYRFYFNGGRLHVVAIQIDGVVYWVSNTLFDRLSNATMVAIARSLRPVS